MKKKNVKIYYLYALFFKFVFDYGSYLFINPLYNNYILKEKCSFSDNFFLERVYIVFFMLLRKGSLEPIQHYPITAVKHTIEYKYSFYT